MADKPTPKKGYTNPPSRPSLTKKNTSWTERRLADDKNKKQK